MAASRLASHLMWPLHGHPGVCDRSSPGDDRSNLQPGPAGPQLGEPLVAWREQSLSGPEGADGLPAALRHQRRRAPGHSPGLAPSLSETSPEGPVAHPRQQEGRVHKAQATWCPHLFAQLRAKRLPLGATGTVLPGPGLGAEGPWAVAGQAAQDG